MNYSQAVPQDLSIVVPTYNERERLAELVDAVLAAAKTAGLAVEVVVVATIRRTAPAFWLTTGQTRPMQVVDAPET